MKWVAILALALAVIVKLTWRHSSFGVALRMNVTMHREVCSPNSLVFWLLLVIALTFFVLALISVLVETE
jgi:hypothetical protein